ncbi:MAG: helicase-related protein [Promethearchaeota archaeon]
MSSSSPTDIQFIKHPYLLPHLVEMRDYQVSIAKIATTRNIMVVLPTSLGKTIVALLALIDVLQKAPKSKIFILAPTRPLVLQHYDTFTKLLKPEIRCILFSSNLSPIKRAYALNEGQIFFSTPQIIQNDLKNQLYSLEGAGQIIFDETHKARKRYAYTFVARTYLDQCKHPLILGLTASPGKDLFRINELCETLQIEQIIFRDSTSPDVAKYTHPIESIIHRIELPDPILKAQVILDTALRKIRDYLIDQGVLPKRNYTSKFQFIQLIQDLKKLDQILDPHVPKVSNEQRFSKNGSNSTGYKYNYDYEQITQELNFPHLYELFNPKLNPTPPAQTAIFSRAINGIYLEHLKEILTTQDIRMYRTYIQKLHDRAEGSGGNRRIKLLLNSKYLKGINQILKPVKFSPKIPELLKILENEIKIAPNGKYIVFSQYREMGDYLTKAINTTNQFRASRFVGQASHEMDRGLNQSEQSEMIHAFADHQFNVLVATSVAEEGLDIPNVNAVIFYDSVPNEIRLIQRRGRTGRHSEGRCHFLVTPNTLDDIYHNVAHRKEAKMHELLQHPEAVQTVSALKRSRQKPVHQNESIEEIKGRYQERKIIQQEMQKEKIEEALKNHHINPLVTDLTAELTNYSKKTSYHHPKDLKKTENQSIDQDLKYTPKKPKLKFLTKKILNWILFTMEILGYRQKAYIYCNIEDLYQAAKEEDINIMKIEREIDYGRKNQTFETRHSQLIFHTI